MYENSAEDKWRAMSTKKVIGAIKKHPKEITSYEVWCSHTHTHCACEAWLCVTDTGGTRRPVCGEEAGSED